MKKSLTLWLVLLIGSTVHASVMKSNLGLDVLASKTASIMARDNKADINLNEDLKLDKSFTAYEIYSGVSYDQFSVRGCHFFPKNHSGAGILSPQTGNLQTNLTKPCNAGRTNILEVK